MFGDDCLKSKSCDYFSRHQDFDENSRPKIVKMRPSDELFAFNWFELPKNVIEAVVKKISYDYGFPYDEDDSYIRDIMKIFKVLVTRDVTWKLAFAEPDKSNVKDGKDVLSRQVFNESAFQYDFKDIVLNDNICQTSSRYFIKANISLRDEWKDGENEYFTMRSVNRACLDRENECAYSNVDEIRKEIYLLNSSYLRKYIWPEKCRDVFESLTKIDILKKNTFTLTKKMFMENPYNMESDQYDQDLDKNLICTIKKYKLSTEVDYEFIDWIAGGCKKKKFTGKTSKLDSKSASIVKNIYSYPRMSRGNVVQIYHGIDSMSNIEVGTVFQGDSSKYVVLDVGGHDPDDEAFAYAKLGTTINSHGFIDPSKIMYGCDCELVEDCWDALWNINRVGKRKKIYKNFKIIKK